MRQRKANLASTSKRCRGDFVPQRLGSYIAARSRDDPVAKFLMYGGSSAVLFAKFLTYGGLSFTGGTDISTPAVNVHNENPSLYALGKTSSPPRTRERRRRTDGRTDGWTADGRMDGGRTDERTDGRMDGNSFTLGLGQLEMSTL